MQMASSLMKKKKKKQVTVSLYFKSPFQPFTITLKFKQRMYSFPSTEISPVINKSPLQQSYMNVIESRGCFCYV